MNLLPYSNSFHKIKIKKTIKPLDLIRTIAIALIAVIIFGLVFQVIKDKIDANKIKPRNKFVRIDNKKYYYSLTGTGDYTVILDSSIGAGSYQWQKVREGLKKEFNGKIFTYDRAGYGFSEFGGNKSPEEQARILKMILKKVGIYGSVILVGEEYGSLIMTNYANLYEDSVAGMVLVNPINESLLTNKDFLNIYNKDKFQRKFQKKVSYFGINEGLKNMNLLKNPSGIDEFLNETNKSEFHMLRSKTNYNSAYIQDLDNLNNYKGKSQKKDMLGNKPLAIIASERNFKDEQISLKELVTEEAINKKIVEITTVDNSKDIIALEKPESVISAIKFVFNKCKK